MKKILILIISIIMMIGLASSTTYYVSPAGDNGNTGLDWNNAWKTIGDKINTISPNDLVLLDDGEWEEVAYATSGGAFYINVENVTIKARNSGMTTLILNDSFGFAGVYPSKDNIKIEGINFESTTTSIYPTTWYSADGVEYNNVSFINFDKGIRKTNAGGDVNVYYNNVEFINQTSLFGSQIYQGFFYFTNCSFDDGSFSYQTSLSDDIFYGDFYNISNIVVEEFTFKGNINIETEQSSLFVLDNYNQLNWNLSRIHFKDLISSNQSEILNFSNMIFDYNKNNIYPYDDYHHGLIKVTNQHNPLIIKDIVFGSEFFPISDDRIDIDDTGTLSAIYVVNPKGLYIDNITCYLNKSNGCVYTLEGDNLEVKNSNGYCLYDGLSGSSKFCNKMFKTLANNTIMENNVADLNQIGYGYDFGCGNEGSIYGIVDYVNCTIINNSVYSENLVNDGVKHHYFIGSYDNAFMSGNYFIGGGYGAVIKGTNNSIIQDNKFIFTTATSGVAIMLKSGQNTNFTNLNIENGNVYMTCDSDYSYDNDLNIVNLDITTGTSGWWLSFNSLCLMKDVVNVYNLSTDNKNISSLMNAEDYYTEYFSLRVLNHKGQSLFFRDSLNNEYGPYIYNNDIPLFFKSYYQNGNVLNESYNNYTWEASQYDQSENGTFILNAPYILTLPAFSRSIKTCRSIEDTVFNAMNLGIVAIIVLIASVLIGAVMAFGGANFDVGTITVTVLTVILVAIMFLIGTVVVATIGGAIC